MSRQSRGLRACFLEHRDVRIGVFPQRQEIAIGSLRLCSVAREHERTRQLQARHGIEGIDKDDAAVIDDPLKFSGRLRWLTRGKLGQSPHVDVIETAEASDEADAAEREIVARGGLQRLERGSWIAGVQGKQRLQRR